jgi:hypothetical protein
VIINLGDLTPETREEILKRAGDILVHVPFPDLHPNHKKSGYIYMICVNAQASIAHPSELQHEGEKEPCPQDNPSMAGRSGSFSRIVNINRFAVNQQRFEADRLA